MNITNARVPGFFNSRFHIDIPNDHDIGPIEGVTGQFTTWCIVPFISQASTYLYTTLSVENALKPLVNAEDLQLSKQDLHYTASAKAFSPSVLVLHFLSYFGGLRMTVSILMDWLFPLDDEEENENEEEYVQLAD